jgi:probable phosphoglycerate mutase
MELLLIRHALPVRRELDSGAADPDLADDGHRQAQLLANYLTSEDLDAVYTSPMRRARQTAAPLALAKGLDPVVHEGVSEWDRNSTWYVPIEELKATNDPRWQAMVDGWTGPDDLSPERFQDIVVTAVEEIVSAHSGGRIAIVCHGGVINTYLARILGLANPKGFFYPNYTSIHRVMAAASGQRSIVTVNETAHLRGSGLVSGLYS